MMQTATPALLRVFGIPAVHTTREGESNVTILFAEQSVAIGEYGERMEAQTTIQIPAASALVWAIPLPSPVRSLMTIRILMMSSGKRRL
jgi:hypothetical protein